MMLVDEVEVEKSENYLSTLFDYTEAPGESESEDDNGSKESEEKEVNV
jgi:hypothetical protein